MKTLWNAQDIAKATQGTCTGAWQASDVSIDSRTVKQGDLFVALKGPQFDGHDFLKAAIEKGASGALVARVVDGVAQEKCVVVPDVFEALIQLGHAGRARAQAKILAVTGSAGKTGCKEALRQILNEQSETFANEGSFNNHWGVPLSLSRLPPSAQYGVFEMGMNHVGELGPLSKQVQPHFALITNIAAVHIGNFANLDEIAGAKAEIFEGLSPDGHAILNADNPYFDFLAARAQHAGIKNIHGFGQGKSLAAQLLNFTLGPDSSKVQANVLGRTLSYIVGAPGEHWVINSLAVLLTAALAGADVKRAADALSALSLAQGRGVPERIEGAKGTFTLIDESYNASPVATDMAIKVLGRKTLEQGGRRLLALGDMRELGEHGRDLHTGLMPAIVGAGISRVYCCGELMKHLFDALPPELRGEWRFSASELAPVVAAAIQPHDIITIKGSKSMAMYKVVDALRALNISGKQSQLKTA